MKNKRMKTKVHLIFIAIFLTSTLGCVTNRLTPVTDPTTRIDILGVSMLPPGGNGWSYVKISPTEIHFGKTAHNNGQSFVGVALLVQLPDTDSQEDFVKVISSQRARNLGNPKFENLINDEVYSEEKGTPSVRFYTKYKEFGSRHMPEGASHFIVEDIGLICRHPENKNIATYITLSQRSLPEDVIENFTELANQFIGNAEFTSLPQ